MYVQILKGVLSGAAITSLVCLGGCGFIGYDPIPRVAGGLESDVPRAPGGASDGRDLPESGASDAGFADEAALAAANALTLFTAPEFCPEHICPPGYHDFAQATPTAASFSAGGCALTEDRRLMCWGINVRGGLGRGFESPFEETPDMVPGLERVAGVVGGNASGDPLVCAWTLEGEAYCWGGAGAEGGRGDGSYEDAQPSPARVLNVPPVRRIAIDGRGACAVTTEDDLYCWGQAIPSGLVDAQDRAQPRRINDNSWHVLTVFGGVKHHGTHCIVRKEDGQHLCWGSNFGNKLGYDTAASDSPSFDVPRPIPGLPSRMVSITFGDGVGCGVDSSGVLWCWGNNTSGEMGRSIPRSSAFHASTPVETDVRFRQVRARHDAVCALSVDDRVFCWGNHGMGQVPTPISNTPEGILHLGGGDMHNTLVDAQGRVYSFGWNNSGRLGRCSDSSDCTSSSQPELVGIVTASSTPP